MQFLLFVLYHTFSPAIYPIVRNKTTQSGNADDRYGFAGSNTATAPPSSQRAKLSRPLLRTLRSETESALASDGVRAAMPAAIALWAAGPYHIHRDLGILTRKFARYAPKYGVSWHIWGILILSDRHHFQAGTMRIEWPRSVTDVITSHDCQVFAIPAEAQKGRADRPWRSYRNRATKCGAGHPCSPLLSR